MTEDQITRERAAFEADWAASGRDPAWLSRRPESGEYDITIARLRFEGWMARAASIPDGYVMVPAEPTLNMSIFGQAEIFDRPSVDRDGENLAADHVWRAMIAASPQGETP